MNVVYSGFLCHLALAIINDLKVICNILSMTKLILGQGRNSTASIQLPI